jgi:phenylacetate-CoA ligase
MVDIDYGPPTRDALEALQLERLRWSIGHAFFHVARFREACGAKGVTPADLQTLSDLALFPFTTKNDLRDAYPFGMFAAPQDRIARIHASSGTTGRPTVVGYTARDIRIWAALVARSLHAAGARPGMKAHVAYGYGLFTGGLGAHYGAEALGCAVIPVSAGNTERQVQLIEDVQPEVILVTPSYMLCILDEYRRQGLDARKSSLRYGVFGAEPWTEAMRAEIEDAFAIEATDIYGLSEVMGPGVAQQLRGEPGLTIWEDHFLPEIVDPESGNALREGEEGELVLTSLSKEALPVIRYRTRDLTRLLPGESLPYRRMAKIVGRSDDMLIIRGVNVYPTHIEELVLKCPGLSPHFVIEITRPARLDEVAIEVEVREGVDEDAGTGQCRLLAASVKNAIGISVQVSLKAKGGVSRSTGKAIRVRDLRGRAAKML